jgi:hypothetical protein
MWLSEVPGLELRGAISVGKGLAVLRSGSSLES